MLYTSNFANYYLDHFASQKIKDERKEIENIYNDPQWDDALKKVNLYNYRHFKKLRITKNAYALTKKLKEELDIKVFPVIFPLYPGRGLKSSGAWVWTMCEKGIGDIGSCERVKDLLLKKYKLVYYRDGEIMSELK